MRTNPAPAGTVDLAQGMRGFCGMWREGTVLVSGCMKSAEVYLSLLAMADCQL